MDEPKHAAAHLARNLISLRSVRTLTQDALAKSSGLPRSTIANLESGDSNPSLAVMIKIANALGVPMDELLASPRAKVRKWSPAELHSSKQGNGVTVHPLVPEPVPQEVLNIMEFAPGAAMRGSPHLPGTREFFTCLDGRISIVVAGERHELGAGDVLGFPGNLPHSYFNPEPEQAARGVSVVILAKAGI
ncbi:MAG: XRE family transcriptional regulator [Pseudomonadota bacterium]